MPEPTVLKNQAPHGTKAKRSDGSCTGCLYEHSKTCPTHPSNNGRWWCRGANRLDGCEVIFVKRKDK